MERREFITLLGGVAAALPISVRAQHGERVRRVGVLMNLPADDSQGQAFLSAFREGLAQLGWADGRNIRFDIRWGGGDVELIQKSAAELIALSPDVVLANGSPATAPLLQATRTLPIVFATVIDPVGAGFVDSIARPGGNATGFTNFEYGIAVKWLELLKEVSPTIERAAILRDAASVYGSGQLGAIQSVASMLGIELRPVNVREAGEIERALTEFARATNGGMIVTAGSLANSHRKLIVALAAQNRLPAVYFNREFVALGGLISYGINMIDQYRRAAGYVDRILKGEKPANLPVQAPTKYELVINAKTARTLGLMLPQSVLGRVDEVID